MLYHNDSHLVIFLIINIRLALPQILTAVAYVLSISAFPIWGTIEHDFVCFDLTLESNGEQIYGSFFGSFNPSDADPVCFSLEFVQGQLDYRNPDESWKRYLYLAVLMGLVTAVCGFVALILSMSVNCSTPGKCRLGFTTVMMILSLGFQILTFFSFGTEVCDAYLPDIDCTINSVTPDIGGQIGAAAVVAWFLAILSNCCLTSSVLAEK